MRGEVSPLRRYVDLRIVCKMQVGRMAGIKMLEIDSPGECSSIQSIRVRQVSNRITHTMHVTGKLTEQEECQD